MTKPPDSLLDAAPLFMRHCHCRCRCSCSCSCSWCRRGSAAGLALNAIIEPPSLTRLAGGR